VLSQSGLGQPLLQASAAYVQTKLSVKKGTGGPLQSVEEIPRLGCENTMIDVFRKKDPNGGCTQKTIIWVGSYIYDLSLDFQ
jgi:hypothetical protein